MKSIAAFLDFCRVACQFALLGGEAREDDEAPDIYFDLMRGP